MPPIIGRGDSREFIVPDIAFILLFYFYLTMFETDDVPLNLLPLVLPGNEQVLVLFYILVQLLTGMKGIGRQKLICNTS